MSVCRKLPDGTIQKIAGHTILLDANASEVRQGTFNVTGGPAGWVNQTITFTDPMPDTDYVIVLECNNQSWGGGGNFPGPFRIHSKTTTGFVLGQFNTTGNEGFSFTGTYTAWKPVKIEGYTELQNKVNNPDSTPTEGSLNFVTSGGVYDATKAVQSGTGTRNTSYVSSDNFFCNWFKVGRICFVDLQYNLSQLTPSSVQIITGLPRPIADVACVGEGGQNAQASGFVIQRNGGVRTHYDGGAGQFVHGTATYITAE